MCNDCNEAKKFWDWHGYKEDCEACSIRAIANCSPKIRNVCYRQKAYRLGKPAGRLLKEAVELESDRIDALHKASPYRWWQRAA